MEQYFASVTEFLTHPDRPAAINRAIWRGMTSGPKDGIAAARILVADGDDRCRETVSQLLTEAGHEVDSARDGVEAIRVTEWAPKDLLITALSLPVSSGPDLIRNLRSRFPQLKVIVLMSHDEPEENVLAARAVGADRILTRPIESERLIEYVEEVVGEGS
jgi:CheY-like chemotaxis protein